MTGSVRRKGIFYGWFIVAATFVAMFVSMGARGGVGVFIVPMSEDLTWSRGTISFALAVGWLMNGLSQPFAGRLIDRFGARKVISVSLLVLGIAIFMLSQTNSIWFLLVVYGLVVSIAMSGASLVTVHAVLARWFFRMRGVVMGIGTAGFSAGALILTPFAAYLIIVTNWRVAWAVLGILILVVALPLVVFFVRDDPADMGMRPDGDAEEISSGASSGVRHTRRSPLEVDDWRDSFKSRPMWLLSGGYLVCGMTTALMAVHYVPFAIDRGVSPGNAAIAFGMMMGLNAVGVIAVGMISDRLGRKNLLSALYAFRGLAYLVLLMTPGALGIWGFALIAGFSWIATAPLTASLTAEIYGLKNMGTLNGLETLAHQLGGALAIFVAGVLYDALGSYTVPFGFAGVMLVGASLVSFKVREKQYSSRYQRPATTPMPTGDGD